MRNQKWRRVILFAGIICIAFSRQLRDIHANTYKYGMITVRNEELPAERNGHRIQFNHPYKLTESVVADVLSSIYYKEKGLFKRKGVLRVFQDKEIKHLVPLIVQAFSVATPTQVISAASYSERVVLTDKYNYCILFITDHDLNIAFGHVHKFQTFNDIMSNKKKYFSTRENPAHKRRSSFWELIPSSGQRLEPGHENWLITGLSN
ncbi:MAG TPA: hypothetical protein ACFYEC_02320 [Candidatus Brocadiaceae bacterium]